MSTRILISLLLAASTIACGGSTSQESSTGGTSGSGGSSGGAGGSTGGSAGAGGSTGGSGGSSCDQFADEKPPGAVTFRYTNLTSVPIYLGGGTGCDSGPLYDLSGPQGLVPAQAGPCGHTCQALQTHGNYCAGACMIPPLVMIIPGGYYEETWSGTTFEDAQMPEQCYFEPEFAQATCDRRIVGPEGSYGVMVQAGTTISCLDVGVCGCQPDANGSCQIPNGGSAEGPALSTKMSFEMPGTSMVSLAFQ